MRLALSDVVQGFWYLVRGYRVLKRYPELARYWLAPVLLTLVALCASLALAWAYHDEVLSLVWADPPLHGVLHVVYGVLRMFTFLLTLCGLVFVCLLSSTVVAAPFNDALSEAVEARVTATPSAGFSPRMFARELLRSLGLALLRFLLYGAVMAPLYVFSWALPGIGQPLYLVVAFWFTTAYLALDYIDWPASRAGLPMRARLRLLYERPFLILGFGVSVWLCLFIPLLNLLFMPLAVAGGTLLFVDLRAGAPHPVRIGVPSDRL